MYGFVTFKKTVCSSCDLSLWIVTCLADGGIILGFHTQVHAWILFHHILKINLGLNAGPFPQG